MQPASWASVFAVLMGVAALAGLAYAIAWWAALLVLLLMRLVAGPGLGLLPKQQGSLSVQGVNGDWVFEQHGVCLALTLRHVWHGPVWTTLGFLSVASGKPVQFTVWRSRVSPAGWRSLRQLTTRGPAAPRLRATEGQ